MTHTQTHFLRLLPIKALDKNVIGRSQPGATQTGFALTSAPVMRLHRADDSSAKNPRAPEPFRWTYFQDNDPLVCNSLCRKSRSPLRRSPLLWEHNYGMTLLPIVITFLFRSAALFWHTAWRINDACVNARACVRCRVGVACVSEHAVPLWSSLLTYCGWTFSDGATASVTGAQKLLYDASCSEAVRWVGRPSMRCGNSFIEIQKHSLIACGGKAYFVFVGHAWLVSGDVLFSTLNRIC